MPRLRVSGVVLLHVVIPWTFCCAALVVTRADESAMLTYPLARCSEKNSRSNFQSHTFTVRCIFITATFTTVRPCVLCSTQLVLLLYVHILHVWCPETYMCMHFMCLCVRARVQTKVSQSVLENKFLRIRQLFVFIVNRLKFTLEQALKAQRGRKDIVLLCL